jgi:hypothetical protein
MNVKWFIIGIIVGMLIFMGISIAIVMSGVWDYESIEQVCFDQTFTPEEYETCVRNLGGTS